MPGHLSRLTGCDARDGARIQDAQIRLLARLYHLMPGCDKPSRQSFNLANIQPASQRL